MAKGNPDLQYLGKILHYLAGSEETHLAYNFASKPVGVLLFEVTFISVFVFYTFLFFFSSSLSSFLKNI